MELNDSMTIVYYCMKRRQHFRRKVLVDRDLEIQRKLNGAILALQNNSLSSGNDALTIMRVGGTYYNKSNGESSSLPAYLFGEKYFRARRKNLTTHWDLRRSAFEPVQS